LSDAPKLQQHAARDVTTSSILGQVACASRDMRLQLRGALTGGASIEGRSRGALGTVDQNFIVNGTGVFSLRMM
jgi:hypothetical protein